MLKRLLPVGVIAALALAGCTGQIDAQQDGVHQYKQVSLAAYSLSTQIRVDPPQYERVGNGQLKVKMLARNLTDGPLTLDYQYRFVDKSGMDVENGSGWMHVTLPRKGVAPVEFTSLTPAEDFRVEFRHAE